MSRRVAPLLAAIAVVGAVNQAGAQAPTRAGATKTLLSDCDVTQGSCGGTPYLDSFGVGGGGGSGAGGFGSGYGSDVGGSGASGGFDTVIYVCDGGNLTECRRINRDVCARWVVTSANGQISVTIGPGATGGGSVGAGATWTCTDHTVETTIIRLRRVVVK